MPIMNVNDIRPEDLVTKQQKHIDSDISWLLKKTDSYIDVECPCCGSDKRNFRMLKNRFQFYDCEECYTIYMSPRPTPEILKHFYSKSQNYKFWAEIMFPRTEAKRKYIFESRVVLVEKLLKQYNPKASCLLEVGPGYGTFCRLLKDRIPFLKIEAVEPSSSLAKICKDSGINVTQDSVEEFSLKSKNKFDVIVCFEVIEHISNPLKTLQSFHKLLNKNGIILFSCPNGLGFDIKILQEKSETIDHEHLNLFNPKAIHKLLERAHFQEVETLTPGELDVSIVKREFNNQKITLKENNFLHDFFSQQNKNAEKYFQQFLKKAKLSSNMLTVAKK